MSVVELLVYVWAACKYLVFTVQGPGTPVSVSFCCPGFSFLFFMNASLCLLFLNFFHIWSYCARFFLFLFFFFILRTEEFRFPVHAWVCRYYRYVRVFVNVHTMRFAILLHRQAFMYIHVHVLRGFQTYILLFSNLFSSASFFFVFALLLIVATALQCLSTYAFEKRHCHWVLCARLLYMYPHVLVV